MNRDENKSWTPRHEKRFLRGRDITFVEVFSLSSFEVGRAGRKDRAGCATLVTVLRVVVKVEDLWWKNRANSIFGKIVLAEVICFYTLLIDSKLR